MVKKPRLCLRISPAMAAFVLLYQEPRQFGDARDGEEKKTRETGRKRGTTKKWVPAFDFHFDETQVYLKLFDQLSG